MGMELGKEIKNSALDMIPTKCPLDKQLELIADLMGGLEAGERKSGGLWSTYEIETQV